MLIKNTVFCKFNNAIHTRKNREQTILFPQSLDQIVAPDNEVRIIDLFAESINLADFKFLTKNATEGRPAYNPKDLLKLFVYGYLNPIRSSRVLEKGCHRNVEVMWLMKQLAPHHNSISNCVPAGFLQHNYYRKQNNPGVSALLSLYLNRSRL